MAGPIDIVIAGTKPFALALFAPVIERAGSRPRIAPEPSAALTLCGESTGVLVLEYEPRWLPVLAQLRALRPALRVVAALPRGQEGAALSLGQLSFEVVPWTGLVESVLPAVERALGASRSGAAGPGAPAPASAPPEGGEEVDLFGDLDAVPAPPQPVGRPAVPAPPPPPPPPGPGQPPELDLFQDLGGSAATPVPAGLPAVTVRSGEAAWPATGPGAEEAELALRGALTGTAGPSPLRAVAEQTAAVLSPLERLVFTGGASPVDSEVIRRAAVLRLRAAATMAIRPPPGSPVDGAAVAGLLSEIDALLGAVKDLLDQAPLEAQVSLETIRNALVKEAVDFSEASHEIGAGDASLPPPRRITGRGAAVRVISVNAGVLDEDRPEERRRGWVIWVVLALAALGAGGFHGFSWWQKEQASAELKTLPGQPEGMMLVPGPPGSVRTLIPLQGPIDRNQLERFKTQQQLLGNVVTELPGGGLSVSREPPPPKGADQRAP